MRRPPSERHDPRDVYRAMPPAFLLIVRQGLERELVTARRDPGAWAAVEFCESRIDWINEELERRRDAGEGGA